MSQTNEKQSLEGVIISSSPELVEYALQNNIHLFRSNEEYLKSVVKKPSLYDFTRKSVVGAFYRVGSSFTADATLFAIMAGGLTDFIQDLDPGKLLRVAAFVVGINFVDYKFDVTNKLDKYTKLLEDFVKDKFGYRNL